MDDVKDLYPEVDVPLSTRPTVSVSPVGFRKLGKFGEALIAVVTKLEAKGIDTNKLVNGGLAEFSIVLTVAFDEVVNLMAIVLDKELAWFDKLPPADGVTLLQVIYKQNWNDANKKKVQEIMGLLEKVNSA